ncbi:hypothetical protein F5146DRAFT_1000256 [Armillaria mellea]|nr:hypothetical protein F5146DRAFT_1000256 [Armillaria mellea]
MCVTLYTRTCGKERENEEVERKKTTVVKDPEPPVDHDPNMACQKHGPIFPPHTDTPPSSADWERTSHNLTLQEDHGLWDSLSRARRTESAVPLDLWATLILPMMRRAQYADQGISTIVAEATFILRERSEGYIVLLERRKPASRIVPLPTKLAVHPPDPDGGRGALNYFRGGEIRNPTLAPPGKGQMSHMGRSAQPLVIEIAEGCHFRIGRNTNGRVSIARTGKLKEI